MRKLNATTWVIAFMLLLLASGVSSTAKACGPFTLGFVDQLMYYNPAAYNVLCKNLGYTDEQCKYVVQPQVKPGDDKDIWVPNTIYQNMPEDSFSGKQFAAGDEDHSGITDKRDMFRSTNFTTLWSHPDYVNQACVVKTESELREALRYAFGFSTKTTYQAYGWINIIPILPGDGCHNIGEAIATWAFQFECLTGIQETISSDQTIQYKFFPKMCDGGVKDAKRGDKPAPVLWQQVPAASVASTGNLGCVLDDAGDTVNKMDQNGIGTIGKTVKQLKWVWVVADPGKVCAQGTCSFQKTIVVDADRLDIQSPIQITERAPYVDGLFEVTITGKNGQTPKIGTATGFKPVTKDVTGVFVMNQQIDTLRFNKIQYDGQKGSLANGSEIVLDDVTLVNSKFPLLMQGAWKIVNSQLISSEASTLPLIKVSDSASGFKITNNTFTGTLPSVAIQLSHWGCKNPKVVNPSDPNGSYTTCDGDVYGEIAHNNIASYVSGGVPYANPFYLSGSSIASPRYDPNGKVMYYPESSCTGKITTGGVGCYSIPLVVDAKTFAVELYNSDGTSLGVVCHRKKNKPLLSGCSGELEIQSDGTQALGWVSEYVHVKKSNGTASLESLTDLQLPEGGGAVPPLKVSMIAYGSPVNVTLGGEPSALSQSFEIDFFKGQAKGEDLQKAKQKNTQWVTGPMSKWGNACVDNKTCGKDDVTCKVACGWTNACLELQEEINRIVYCKFKCTKMTDAEMTISGGMKVGYKVCAEMDFAAAGGDKDKCAQNGGIYSSNGIDQVAMNQLMDGWIDFNTKKGKVISYTDPATKAQVVDSLSSICSSYYPNGADTDNFKKYAWKNFGGHLDYEPEDPKAVACYWDAKTGKLNGKNWEGGVCVPTAESKCIWNDTTATFTGKYWGSDDKCYDSLDVYNCSQAGNVLVGGKCLPPQQACEQNSAQVWTKDGCKAKPKDYAQDKSQCAANSGKWDDAKHNCQLPLTQNDCVAKGNQWIGGACIISSDAGDSASGQSGQSGTVPNTDNKPLTTIGADVVQVQPEAESGSSSGAKKFWGCSLVR